MTAYFISAAGNNANSGTSPSSPWLTIGKVNGFAQQPGDTYAFHGGDTFTDATLTAASSGVTFTSYGTGNATISQASHSGNDGFSLTQFSNVTVSNLNFVGSLSSTTAVGVRCLFPSGSYTNLTLSGLTVSNFGSDGIRVSCWTSGGPGGTLSNLLIDLCTVSNCTFGDSNPSPPDAAHPTNGIGAYGYFGSDVSGTYNLTNVTISRCSSYNNPGNFPRNPSSGSGIYMAEVNGGLITQCVAHDNGGITPNVNFCPIGIWMEDTANVTIQYCESYNNMNPPGDGDAGGFDLDGGCKNCTIQYCYSHHNNGNGFESLALDTNPGGAVTGNHNNIIRYNVSESDAQALTVSNQAGIVVSCVATVNPNSNVQVYGNTVYSSVSAAGVPCLVYGSFGGSISGTIANNIFYSISGSLVSYFNFTNIHLNFYGNCYFPGGGTSFVFFWNGVGYASLAALQTGAGQEVLNGNPVGLQTDPGLNSPGNGGTIATGANYVTPAQLATLSAYMINPGSAAYRVGLNLTSNFAINPGPTDFYSNPITSGTLSIGADCPIGGLAWRRLLAQQIPQAMLGIHPPRQVWHDRSEEEDAILIELSRLM